MSNEELVIRIQAGIDEAENKLMLWQQCQKFITMLAKKYTGQAEIEDLEQEGYFGLCEAVERYNPDEGVKFLTYASHWIKQKMLRYIHNNGTVRISVHEHERLIKYRKLSNAFLSQIGREPTDKEISYYLDISFKQIKQLKKNARITQISSLDSPVNGAEGITLGDSVAGHEDMESQVLDEVEAEQLKAAIWPIVDNLPAAGSNQSQISRRFDLRCHRPAAGDYKGSCKTD